MKKNITIIAFCTLFSTATSSSWGKSIPVAVLQAVKSFLNKDIGKKALKIGLPVGGLAILAGLTGYGVKKVMQRRRREAFENDLLYCFSDTPFIKRLIAIKEELDKKGILTALSKEGDFSKKCSDGAVDLFQRIDTLSNFSQCGKYIDIVQELTHAKDFVCALGADGEHVKQRFEKAITDLSKESGREGAKDFIENISTLLIVLEYAFDYCNSNRELIKKNKKNNWSNEGDRNEVVQYMGPSFSKLLSSAQELLGFETLGEIEKIDNSAEAKDFFEFIFTFLYALAQNSNNSGVKKFMQNVHNLEEFKNLPIKTILESGLIPDRVQALT